MKFSLTRPARVLFFITVFLLAISAHSGNRQVEENSIAELQNPATIDPADVTIVRDKWGVPHVYGKTDADAVYGLSWAHAEDDFKSIQETFLAVRGRLSRYKGKEGAIWDVMSFVANSPGQVDRAMAAGLDEDHQMLLGAATQAWNDYAVHHPDELIDKTLFPIGPRDILLSYEFGEAVFADVIYEMARALMAPEPLSTEWRKPEGLSSLLKEDGCRHLGSNGWVFSPSRVAEGDALLIGNPHVRTEGMWAFYEAHVNSEEGWNFHGVTLGATLVPVMGVNDHLGWRGTVNRPDLHDLYELSMHPKKKGMYRFDGEWYELEKRVLKLKVKLGPFRLPVKKTFYYSKYGITFKNKYGYFSLRHPSSMQVGSIGQTYRMSKATDLQSWRAQLNRNRIPQGNFLYADGNGHIFYQSLGNLPRKSASYHWDGIVRGDTSATLWGDDLYPVSQLPSIQDPECGWIASFNNTPFSYTCPDESPSASGFDSQIGLLRQETNRSLRWFEIIEQEGTLPADTWLQYKYDTQFASSTMETYYLGGLDDITKLDPGKYPKLAESIRLLKSWDGSADVEDEAASIMALVLHYLIDIHLLDRFALYRPNQLSEEELVMALTYADKHLRKHFGAVQVPLGELQIHERGGKTYPMPGLPEQFINTWVEDWEDGKLRLIKGDTYIMQARFTQAGVKLKTIMPYGASANPDSPHYTDQMEDFVAGRLKTMSLDREEVFKSAARIYSPMGLEANPSAEAVTSD